jgi:hypothetical protein
VVAMKGHFDGKVIVPDEPVDLPVNQPLIVRVEPADGAATPPGVPGAALLRFAGSIERSELEAMRGAIDEGCGRVDPNDW